MDNQGRTPKSVNDFLVDKIKRTREPLVVWFSNDSSREKLVNEIYIDDQKHHEDVDFVYTGDWGEKIPLPDSCVDQLISGRFQYFTNKVRDRILFMSECHRILKKGGEFNITGISGNSNEYLDNPYNSWPHIQNTFRFFSNQWEIIEPVRDKELVKIFGGSSDYEFHVILRKK